jgi:hypothetical protein
VYTKLGVHDLSGALNGLPSLTPAAAQRERLRAVGTYDDHPMRQSDPHLFPHQLTRGTTRPSAASREETDHDAGGLAQPDDACNPLESAADSDAARSYAKEKRRGRDSNPRYRLIAVRRFSKPLPSATRPPLPRAVLASFLAVNRVPVGPWDSPQLTGIRPEQSTRICPRVPDGAKQSAQPGSASGGVPRALPVPVAATCTAAGGVGRRGSR